MGSTPSLATMYEAKKRTVLKTITYRSSATVVMAFAYWLYNDDVTGGILYSIAVNLLLTILYYIHERLWLRTDWGTNDRAL